MNGVHSGISATKASDEFRSGWPVLLTAVIGSGVGVSSITLYSSGLFVQPLEQSVGWSRALISFGAIVTTLGIAVGMPIVGPLIDRFGARRVATASLLALAACYAGLSAMPASIYVYFGLLFLMGSAGSGSSPIAFTRAVSAWFRQARGLALGITLAGPGLVGVIAPQILGPLIRHDGWRAGYRGLAITIAIATPLIWAWLRDPTVDAARGPPPTVSGVSFRTALRTPALWIMAGAFTLSVLPISATMFHFVPILTAAGVSGPLAVRATSILGVSVIISRLCTGFALDRLFAPWLGAFTFAGAAAGCLVLRSQGASHPLLGGFLISFAMGTEVDLVAFMVGRYLGLRAYGRIFGLLFSLFVLASGLGPFVFGILFDHFAGYGAALIIAVALLGLAICLMLLMPRYPATLPDEDDAPAHSAIPDHEHGRLAAWRTP